MQRRIYETQHSEVERSTAKSSIEVNDMAYSGKKSCGVGPAKVPVEGKRQIPGVRNVGLLATHELRVGVPQRPDWPRQTAAGRRLLQLRGRRLLDALGFSIDPLDSTSSVLSVGTQQRAVALLLEESETFVALGSRFPQASPVSLGLALAKRQGLPRVMLLRGPQVRLYSARSDTGVGRKGRG